MNTLPPLPCYLNGEFTLLPDAKISVMDRGFIFGDGVYEVVPVYAGQAFRFEQHMARLDRSLAELRIKNPLSLVQWQTVMDRLLADYARSVAQPVDALDQLIYIQVTRGVAMRDHVMPVDIEPTVFVMSNTMKLPSAEQRSQGVACVTADDFRWEKAHIKSVSLLGAVLARQISADAGALETVMFRNGLLSEAAASNVWVVKDGKVLGPPKNNLVLEGIRYGLIEDLCREQGLGFELRPISRAEVLAADELLLSSATKEVLPITRLDDKPVGQGKPGPVYASLYAGYQAAKQRSRKARSA
ncbi:MAG: D-amino acid aminotransferase [Gammaproteobacteria bacterium]|nr:D-amino acid aminotransferase [Gammaproteobacteria bacterium]MBU0788405.1 D-amino acid aminotransferase [Gammaproteobacteria bacterium]MBU0815738.1 D-amino acid aminotransferase [Gammaproteobacteria bacterium]MBU1788253.1 D-amino acid aminotransferase [Gammaproteobacteria bacterium]